MDSRNGCPTPDGCIMAYMNATPLLSQILRALHEFRLEAVLIGNAAAAVHGAPVATLDFDFMFRDTPTNMRKLKAIAADLRAMILRPFYPQWPLFYRVVNEEAALKAESERQLDDLIQRRLALPLEKRMNFLRRRLPGGGSSL